jgi:hypothetical protein
MVSLTFVSEAPNVADEKEASLPDIKKAITELYTSKEYSGSAYYISLYFDPDEIELRIYRGAVILIDYGRGVYDGPGSVAEVVNRRVEEWSILEKIEQIYNYFAGEQSSEMGLEDILKSLPEEKPTKWNFKYQKPPKVD